MIFMMPVSFSPSLILMVALGGALGSVLRYGAAMLLNAAFPYGTMFVNIAGCTLMGGLASLFAHFWPEHQHLRHFLTIGLLGGFTTFSSFALDIGQLASQASFWPCLFYAGGSILFSLMGFFFAQFLTRYILLGGL